MTIVERLRKEAKDTECTPITPLLNAAADHIVRQEEIYKKLLAKWHDQGVLLATKKKR
jgi:hypothetical protein